jgi:hypothetical protein
MLVYVSGRGSSRIPDGIVIGSDEIRDCVVVNDFIPLMRQPLIIILECINCPTFDLTATVPFSMKPVICLKSPSASPETECEFTPFIVFIRYRHCSDDSKSRGPIDTFLDQPSFWFLCRDETRFELFG